MYRALKKVALIDRNEYQESIGFQFHSSKLSRESYVTFRFNYAGLYKDHSTKETTDNFQRRVP